MPFMNSAGHGEFIYRNRVSSVFSTKEDIPLKCQSDNFAIIKLDVSPQVYRKAL